MKTTISILACVLIQLCAGSYLPSDECRFPFRHKGLWYWDCALTTEHTRSWCSKTTEFNHEWNYCEEGHKVSNGSVCFFPFYYKGVWYNSCTRVNHNGLWCSKDMIYKGAWKNCQMQEMQLSNIQAEARAISWTRVSKNFKAISVGQAGVWGVGTNNKIYYREETYHPNVEEKGSRGGDWQLIGGSLKEISSGYDTVWGVNRHDYIYVRIGISKSSPTGTSWRRISGGLKQISVSPSTNQVWGVNRNDDIFFRTGITIAGNHVGTGWKHIAGKLKFVSVGKAGVWGVNKNNDIFYRKNTNGGETAGTAWEHVPGKMSQVYSGKDTVWAVSNFSVYMRLGVSLSNPTGTSWKRMDGFIKYITASSHDGAVWGIGPRNNAYFKHDGTPQPKGRGKAPGKAKGRGKKY